MARATRVKDRFDDRDTEDMLTLGKLKWRRRTLDGAGDEEHGDDGPIIHETVPEAVLYPHGQDAPTEDRSWLDTVPIVEPVEQNVPEPETAPPAAERQEPEPDGTDERCANVEEISDQVANREASARPCFPYGWLVVVEGFGVGEWFPLERGVSHIGSAEGQTVRLDFGDPSVAPIRHAVLAYDETRHAFVLDSGPDAAVRLNGTSAQSRATLRDGDVISVGATSVRLVALCSPNFHWGSELRTG